VSQFSGEFGNRRVLFHGLRSLRSTASVKHSTGQRIPAGFNPNPTIDPTVANGSSTAFMGKNNAHPARVQMLNFSVQHETAGQRVTGGGLHRQPLAPHFQQWLEQVNQLNYQKYASLGPALGALVDHRKRCSRHSGAVSGVRGHGGASSPALPSVPGDQRDHIHDRKLHLPRRPVQVQKRYSSGLSFLVGYTISKNLTDVDSTPGYFSAGVQDAYNRRSESPSPRSTRRTR